MLLVPSDAVQQVEAQDVVFAGLSADRFAMRPVQTGQPVGSRTAVLAGLKPGEQVVTRGAFVVKSEMLKSAIQRQ